eukprot:1338774-Amphidinium_carterae.1
MRRGKTRTTGPNEPMLQRGAIRSHRLRSSVCCNGGLEQVLPPLRFRRKGGDLEEEPLRGPHRDPPTEVIRRVSKRIASSRVSSS